MMIMRMYLQKKVYKPWVDWTSLEKNETEIKLNVEVSVWWCMENGFGGVFIEELINTKCHTHQERRPVIIMPNYRL